MGFAPEDYADEPDVEIWPENWPAFRIFSDMRTQWIASMGGVIGLNYASLYPLLDRAAGQGGDWDELFSDVQVMELAALPILNKKTD